MSTPEITLQPGEARNVDFTVRVPANTAPGEYLGAARHVRAADDADDDRGPAGAGQATFGITLQGERMIAVEVVVPGAAKPNLQVSKRDAGGRRRRAWFSTSAWRMPATRSRRGSGVVAVDDTNTNVPFTIETFVSHTSITYRVPWTRTVDARRSQRERAAHVRRPCHDVERNDQHRRRAAEPARTRASPDRAARAGPVVERLFEHAARGRRRNRGARVCRWARSRCAAAGVPRRSPADAKSSATRPRG